MRAHNGELHSSDILSKIIVSWEMKNFISKTALARGNVVKIINFMSVGHIMLLFFIKRNLIRFSTVCDALSAASFFSL